MATVALTCPLWWVARWAARLLTGLAVAVAFTAGAGAFPAAPLGGASETLAAPAPPRPAGWPDCPCPAPVARADDVIRAVGPAGPARAAVTRADGPAGPARAAGTRADGPARAARAGAASGHARPAVPAAEPAPDQAAVVVLAGPG
ncbi:hypothetical protein ACSNN9_27440, partial [Micromonospora sp. URMC 107]|uniref:hypothetical protein n=1 Tax=Micromonospora sp. URMC 107 TaxID=3423418 RepID=UPI003F1D3313